MHRVLSIVPVLTNALSYFGCDPNIFSEQKPYVSSILYDFLSLLEVDGVKTTLQIHTDYDRKTASCEY